MNKTFLGIVLTALLCFLGGPFATGLIAADQLERRIELMDTTNPWLSAELASYERGWFTSRAVVELALAADEQAAPFDATVLDALATPVPFVVELSHGPVTLRNGLHFGTAAVTARPDEGAAQVSELMGLLGVPYLFEFRGWSSFTGRFDFDADVPPFTYPSAMGETSFSGLEITGSAAGRRLDISGTFEQAGLQGPFAAGSIGPVRFDLQYQFREDSLPVGTADLAIGRAVATSPLMGNEPLFELGEFMVTQSVRLAGGDTAIDAEAHYSAGLLAIGDATTVTDASIGIRLSGIDSQAAADYYTIVNASMNEPEFDPDLLTSQLSGVLDRIVRSGLRIDVEPAVFSMPTGKFDADIAVAVDGAGLDPDLELDPRNIAVLLDVLTLDATVRVSKPLARDLAARAMRQQIAATTVPGSAPPSEAEIDAAADAQAGLTLATLAGQGLLDDDGTEYLLTARFADGQLTVNGSALGPGFF